MTVYNPSLTFPVFGEAIDATIINKATWDFNKDADDPTTQFSYQYNIYDFDNNLIHTSGIVNSSNPYYDIPVVLSNGNKYKASVKVNNSKTSRVQTFQTQDTPVASVDAPPNPFVHQFYKFTGTVTQVQGVTVKEFQWFLYDATDTIISQSDEITSSIVEHEFTGLANNTLYKVDFRATTQNGLSATSPRVSFTTAYAETVDPEAVIVEGRDDIGMNRLDWTSVVTQIGEVVDANGDAVTPTYVTGKWNQALFLNSGETLKYDLNAPIPKLFSGDFWVKLSTGYNGSFIKFYANDIVKYEIGYEQSLGLFYYVRDGRRAHGLPIAIPTDFFKIIVLPNYIGYDIGGTEYIVR